MYKNCIADISSHPITEPQVFFSRRRFLGGLSVAAMAAGNLLCGRAATSNTMLEAPFKRPDVFPPKRNQAYSLPADIDPRMTPRGTAAVHNNFYEFIPGRGGPVWEHVEDFKVDPWKVVVSGECHEPQTLDLDDLFGFEHEERVYHFRCVERWAMNVPWSGFPLSKLLDRVKPKASARFVRFLSALKPSQMPGVRQARLYPWPYHEALRMDEAMNELTLLATGVYGEPLLKQHGAPIRLIVPWKYGYKSPKSIVKIELVKKQPKTFWQIQAHEYGFLSNVNPYIPHPRWPQNRSHWLDSGNEFPTPLFNGYEKYVAALYPDEPRTLQRALRSGQIAR